MTAFDLTQRCEYASSILADADETSDPVKADRLRSQAGRVLRACSPATYAAELDRLDGEARKARLNQDARGEYQVMEEMRLLARRHPQPDPQKVAMAGLMEAASFVESYMNSSRLAVPVAPSDNSFTRRFRRGRKGR